MIAVIVVVVVVVLVVILVVSLVQIHPGEHEFTRLEYDLPADDKLCQLSRPPSRLTCERNPALASRGSPGQQSRSPAHVEQLESERDNSLRLLSLKVCAFCQR